MNAEQREQAEAWARRFSMGVGSSLEVAALLRAGIAASEECERLRALLERAAVVLERKGLARAQLADAQAHAAELQRGKNEALDALREARKAERERCAKALEKLDKEQAAGFVRGLPEEVE